MNIVADSSTLILMSKITITKLIYNYVDCILIPSYVFEEVIEKGKDKDDTIIIKNLIEESKIKIKKLKENKTMKNLMHNFKINQGEAEALALAMQEKTPLLVDDGEAIKVCKVYDIKFITALALLIKLMKDNKLNKDSAMIKIERLKKIGYYSKEIIENAIKEIN